jgi:hypothetical protein
MSDTRFSSKPAIFVSQIDILDDLQNSPGTPPNSKKYMDWHWTGAENAEVTKMREKADELFEIIKVERSCPMVVKDEMRLLIKEFMVYDHGGSNPHHLLDKIAHFGTLSDWEAANIKRGTPLAKTRPKNSEGMIRKMKHPILSLRSNTIGKHVIMITNPDTPDSKAPPKGFRSILIFCYIGIEPPAGLSDYQQAGKTYRGLFVKSFARLEPQSNKRLYAWYIARYESTKGILNDPGPPLKVPISTLTP